MHEQWWLHCTSQGGGRCHWVSMCTVWPLHSKWLSQKTLHEACLMRYVDMMKLPITVAHGCSLLNHSNSFWVYPVSFPPAATCHLQTFLGRSLCTCLWMDCRFFQNLINYTPVFEETPRAGVMAQKGPDPVHVRAFWCRQRGSRLLWQLHQPCGASWTSRPFPCEKLPACLYASDFPLQMQAGYRIQPHCFDSSYLTFEKDFL